jgi:hypothetical protein
VHRVKRPVELTKRQSKNVDNTKQKVYNNTQKVKKKHNNVKHKVTKRTVYDTKRQNNHDLGVLAAFFGLSLGLGAAFFSSGFRLSLALLLPRALTSAGHFLKD